MSNLENVTPGSDHILILIHGATINGRMWDAVRRHLNPSFRVLAPDLPGHGLRRDEIFTLEGAVETIVAAAKSEAPSPIVLAGDSLGGYTAMAAAAALPKNQLKGLVLGGCTANLSGLVLTPFLFKIAVFKIIFALFSEERFIQKRLPKMLAAQGVDANDVHSMIEGGVSLRVFAAAVNAIRGIDFRARLAAIEQPVLIVNGSRDSTFIKQEADFLAVAQHASSHRFDNCEHGVSILRSAEFAGLVNSFAERVFAG